jgi:hypothetical protein
LVIGIDIGSTTQYARAFDWRGIEIGKAFKLASAEKASKASRAEIGRAHV